MRRIRTNRELLKEPFDAIYDELPVSKKKKAWPVSYNSGYLSLYIRYPSSIPRDVEYIAQCEKKM